MWQQDGNIVDHWIDLGEIARYSNDVAPVGGATGERSTEPLFDIAAADPQQTSGGLTVY